MLGTRKSWPSVDKRGVGGAALKDMHILNPRYILAFLLLIFRPTLSLEFLRNSFWLLMKPGIGIGIGAGGGSLSLFDELFSFQKG